MFCTRTLLLIYVGRPFDIARSNYVVTYYYTELEHMIIALELCDLSISDYSGTFDYSYCLFKSYVDDLLTVFLVWVSSKGLYKLFSRWLILSKRWLFILASVDSRSTLC